MSKKLRSGDAAHGKLDTVDYRALIEASQDMHWVIDEEGCVRFANITLATEYEPYKIIGKPIEHFLHPDDQLLAQDMFKRLRTNPNDTLHDEWRLRKESGGWVPVQVAGTGLKRKIDMSGVVLFMRDISARRTVETKLASSIRNLVEIANFIPEFFWISDAKIEVIEYVSSGYERIWGRTCESLYANPKSYLEAVHPDDLERLVNSLECRDPMENYDIEYRVIQPGGQIRDVWARAYPSRDVDSGQMDRCIGVALDVTEKKRNELDLRLFRKLIDGSSDIMVLINSTTLNIVDVNYRGQSDLGYALAELQSLKFQDLDTAGDRERLLRLADHVAHGGIVPSAVRYESDFRRCDGSTFPVEISIDIVSTDLEYLYATVRDISDRKRLESSMQATIEALISALEKRDLYTAGHQHRVGNLSVAIASIMGLSPDIIRGIGLAGIIHDIGKIGIPAEILSKPGRLSTPEFDLIKLHAQTGYEILSKVDFPWPIAEIVQQHHERCDGSGYPFGLCGDKILIEARIVAVADVIESMTAQRPYRSALGIDAAIREIKNGRGKLYDKGVVDAALALHAANELIPLIT